MRLKTQFIITMLLFGIILIALAVSAVITNQQVAKAARQEAIAGSIAQGANELSYLANDYLIYREGQQLRRWQSRFASFSAQVAGLRVDRPERRALIENIQANKKRLKEVFDSIASAPGGSSREQGGGPDPAFLQVSWSRMAVQSQGLVSDASHLSQLLHERMDRLVHTRAVLIYVMVGLFGLFLLASYILTYRRILKSMATLQAGTAIIGSGNLDFTIDEKKTDEIGDLSRAFNRMTANLKAVTASKADLESEIVERTRAEEELRRQREWLHVTLNSIGDAVITTDGFGRITFLNPVAQALTGWRLEEAEGEAIHGVFRIINEKNRESAEDIVQRVMRDGSVVTLANSTALVTRDGQEIPIEDSAAPIKDGEGNVSGVVLVFHDVSEKRRAEEKIRESEKRYRSLFETMNEGFALHEIICDEHGRPCDYRFLQVNPAFERQTGLKAADLVGHTLREALPQVEDLWVERYGTVALTGQPAQFDQWSEALGCHYEVSAYQTEWGRFAVLVLDVTKRKKAEQALRKARDELEKRVEERTDELRMAYDRLLTETQERERMEARLRQATKMEALGTLTGGIAHDFNNILAAIIGFTEMVRDRAHEESRDRRHLDRVLQAGHRARDLIKQMLAFSRKTEQEKKPLQVASIVKETMRLLRASIPTTVSIKTRVNDGSGLIMGDPAQIQQILMNLCTNAAHVMQGTGGILDVELSGLMVTEEDEKAFGMEPGRYVSLTVRDTGSGISPDIIDRIFDPFFTTKKPGEGTGLGLSVVHGIVRQHDGYVTVESELGKGTTFRVCLPSIADKGQPVGVPAEGDVPTGHERVLFIDDEEQLAEMGCAMLEELGYQVVVKTNSREAVALLRLDPTAFDLVITDQTMPELTGIELAAEVLALRSDMPIVLCTGFSYSVDANKARDAGIKAFAMKPLTKGEIARTIRKALDD